jgi:hypothetical protein
MKIKDLEVGTKYQKADDSSIWIKTGKTVSKRFGTDQRSLRHDRRIKCTTLIDFHAHLVIDCEGAIMGSGHTEWHAIKDAAQSLQMETWDIEALIEKSKNGYQGEEETLMHRTRLEWEASAGTTIEAQFGK